LKGFFTSNCANELQRKTLLDSQLFVAFADRGFPFAFLRVLYALWVFAVKRFLKDFS